MTNRAIGCAWVIAHQPLVNAMTMEAMEARQDSKLIASNIFLAADSALLLRLLGRTIFPDSAYGEARQFQYCWLAGPARVANAIAECKEFLIVHAVHIRRSDCTSTISIVHEGSYQIHVHTACSELFLLHKHAGVCLVISDGMLPRRRRVVVGLIRNAHAGRSKHARNTASSLLLGECERHGHHFIL